MNPVSFNNSILPKRGLKLSRYFFIAKIIIPPRMPTCVEIIPLRFHMWPMPKLPGRNYPGNHSCIQRAMQRCKHGLPASRKRIRCVNPSPIHPPTHPSTHPLIHPFTHHAPTHPSIHPSTVIHFWAQQLSARQLPPRNPDDEDAAPSCAACWPKSNVSQISPLSGTDRGEILGDV